MRAPLRANPQRDFGISLEHSLKETYWADIPFKSLALATDIIAWSRLEFMSCLSWLWQLDAPHEEVRRFSRLNHVYSYIVDIWALIGSEKQTARASKHAVGLNIYFVRSQYLKEWNKQNL